MTPAMVDVSTPILDLNCLNVIHKDDPQFCPECFETCDLFFSVSWLYNTSVPCLIQLYSQAYTSVRKEVVKTGLKTVSETFLSASYSSRLMVVLTNGLMRRNSARGSRTGTMATERLDVDSVALRVTCASSVRLCEWSRPARTISSVLATHCAPHSSPRRRLTSPWAAAVSHGLISVRSAAV